MQFKCHDNRYKVEPSTSQEARRAAEMMAARNMTLSQKDRVACYLAHTTKVADSHYRMLQPQDVTKTAELLLVMNE